MTVRDSQVIKGVAILMMLYLHLFNQMPDVFGYEPRLWVSGLPLVHVLSRAANPVPFYLILSGYGLSYVYFHKGSSLSQQSRRVLRLFIQYWLVLLVFVSLVVALLPGRFSLDATSFWLNASCLKPTYNNTLWFLFPYVLLSLSSGILFRLYERIGPWLMLAVSGVLYAGAACLLSRHVDGVLDRLPVLNQLLLYFYLLFSFLLGVMLERRVAVSGRVLPRWVERMPWLPVAGIVALVVLRCVFNHSFWNPIYAVSVTLLFLCLRRPRWLDAVLAHLGHYSLMMWMCHKFLFEDLLTDFVFGWRWPPLVFMSLLLLTWACAVPLQMAGNWLADLLPALRKREE